MSRHEVRVIEMGGVTPHPNADSLGITEILGYTVVVRLGEWKNGDLAAFIEIDYVCPMTPEFSFLGDSPRSHRIKPRKMRGVWSMGLLMPAPPGAKAGDNVMEALGVTRYEPPPLRGGPEGGDIPAPSGIYPVYDVEGYLKYQHLLDPQETVWVFEKLHGASMRSVSIGGTQYCSSRNNWKADHPNSPWWKALRATPALEQFCRDFPGMAVYGEIYGAVQDLRYGVPAGQIRFAAFDLWDGKKWLNTDTRASLLMEWEIISGQQIPWVPALYSGPANPIWLKRLAEGPSTVPGANHVREGCVIRPAEERWHEEIGRVQMKLINPEYLSR